MVVKEDISLREYLHLLSKRVKDPPRIDSYDEFLIKVWDFFSLRVAAEQYYDAHKYVAFSRHGALPVPWDLLRDTWYPKDPGPPEQPITQIAKRNYNDVNSLLGNLRKMLNRVRQKVPIARVQQVDSHCLRWLTRQPGHTAAEKGGSRQEILGVVRIENYNTLENRVLKDFMRRCIALATMYLRRYDITPHHEHVNVRAVARFKNLCIGGLSVPEFENVRELREFPQPNYVLQQDRLYSKIWTSYGDILRQEDVAEKLWEKRAEIDHLYERCTSGISINCSASAKYATPLWINPLDGRNEIIEKPIWENELARTAVIDPKPPQFEVQTIDLTYPWDNRDELVYPSNHRNARPFIQNPHRPSLEPGESFSLNEILRKRNGLKLRDYFRQLHGLLGGSRWIVLVPDDWEPTWLERVIRSQPPALTRDKMFLLWRSVAAALGMMEQRKFKDKESLVVADGFAVPFYNAVELRFMKERETGRILPQRSSARLHSNTSAGCQDVRFSLGCSFDNQAAVYGIGNHSSLRIGIGRLSPANFVCATDSFIYTSEDEMLTAGVRKFLNDEAAGLVSYFDERDALSLVVQTRAEEVEFKTLVEHDECSPGGRPYKGKLTRGGALQMGAAKLALNLLEGEQRDDEPLKEMQVVLGQKTPKATDIFFEATMTPGQGLASVVFKADFLEKPLPIDLTELKTSTNTKVRIEREMKRHFPPVMPYVEASYELWSQVRNNLKQLISSKKIVDGYLFAKARDYYDGVNHLFSPLTMSPIDLLKRENVFGNNPTNRYPVDDKNAWYLSFFKFLIGLYRLHRNRQALHLLAWTYQYDNVDMDFIRKELHDKYVIWHQSLDEIEVSFCSNNITAGDVHISDMIAEALRRICNGNCGPKELRLLYNLLQFNPPAVNGCESDLCEQAFNALFREYNAFDFYIVGRYGRRWGGQNSTKMAGYFLKCMLFLLHRRRYDANFLNCPKEWIRQRWRWDALTEEQEGVYPIGELGKVLPCKHETMRRSLIEYVNGRGTLEGIPNS